MSELTQWNPNERLMMIANALRNTTDFLNKPGKIAGVGLGDLITGQAGSWVEDRAYGMPMTQGTGFARQLTNKEGLLDTAFLPGVGTAAAVLRKGVPKVATTGMDLGRRAAMGNLGKGAAVAGMATMAPGLIVDALRAGSKEAPSVVAKAVVHGPYTKELAASDIKGFLDMYGEAFEHIDMRKLTQTDIDDLNKAHALERASEAKNDGFSDESYIADTLAKIIARHGWIPR